MYETLSGISHHASHVCDWRRCRLFHGSAEKELSQVHCQQLTSSKAGHNRNTQLFKGAEGHFALVFDRIFLRRCVYIVLVSSYMKKSQNSLVKIQVQTTETSKLNNKPTQKQNKIQKPNKKRHQASLRLCVSSWHRVQTIDHAIISYHILALRKVMFPKHLT